MKPIYSNYILWATYENREKRKPCFKLEKLQVYRKKDDIAVMLTPTFRIRSPIIFIASILVQGGNGWLILLLLFPITPPTIPCPTKAEKN